MAAANGTRLAPTWEFDDPPAPSGGGAVLDNFRNMYLHSVLR
jgi:hypothetical protein